MLFKERDILIPQSLQKEILQHVHQGHQGVEMTRRIARDTVYRVNINRDIEVICKSCHACQENQVINTTGPGVPHTPPARRWQYVACDILETNGMLTDSRLVYEIRTGRLHAQSCRQSCDNGEDERRTVLYSGGLTPTLSHCAVKPCPTPGDNRGSTSPFVSISGVTSHAVNGRSFDVVHPFFAIMVVVLVCIQ